MPLPEPRKSEEHDEFVSRCMDETTGEFPDEDQRYAVCERQWEQDDMKTRAWYQINAKDDIGEVSIFDEIGGFGVQLGDFKRDLDAVRESKSIRVLLNSPGGSVFDGLAIYNLLAGMREKVQIEVLGIAASAASVIAMAGSTRTMRDGSFLMIHNPWGMTIGNAADMREMAGTLDKVAGELVNIYAANSALTREEAQAAMDAETWYTAAEAEEAGFVDGVKTEEKIAAMAFDITKYPYARVPTVMVEQAQPQRQAPDNPRDFEKHLREAGFSQNRAKELVARGWNRREAEEHEGASDITDFRSRTLADLMFAEE